MTAFLATVVLVLWIVNNVCVKQQAYKVLALTAPTQGIFVGLLLAVCIL